MTENVAGQARILVGLLNLCGSPGVKSRSTKLKVADEGGKSHAK